MWVLSKFWQNWVMKLRILSPPNTNFLTQTDAAPLQPLPGGQSPGPRQMLTDCPSHKSKYNMKTVHPCTVGQGIDREGFNFKLAIVKTCSSWPLLNKYALEKRKNEVGLWTPTLLQTSFNVYHSLWEGQKMKIWILFLQWSICFPI